MGKNGMFASQIPTPCSRNLGRRYRRKVALFYLLCIPVCYYVITTVTMPVRFMFTNSNINTPCVVPVLNPFDRSIMKFLWHPDPIVCDSKPSLLFVDLNDGMLKFNETALALLENVKVKCSYSILKRDPDDFSVSFEPEVVFQPPISVPADYFKVVCNNRNGGIVYKSMQSRVYSDALQKKNVIKPDSEKHMSVFMFGIDSTSRSSAVRKLPKTLEFLRKYFDTHEFKGYMKVADNTFPNLVSVLTGKRPYTSEIPIDYAKEQLDSIPFIWKEFSKENYATFYAEDYPEMNTFNLAFKGFKEPPTDHYMRPYWLGVRKMNLLQDAIMKNTLKFLEDKSVKLRKTSSLCYENKPKFDVQIDHFKQFIQQYFGKRRFGFSWLVEICHEFVNFIELGDESFLRFFRWLKESGNLENAVLIFFSDHGSRIDDIRNTFVGRIEERMPLLTISLPERFRTLHPELHKNIATNAGRLTTPFDLYATLKDILNGSFNGAKSAQNSRGVSLFSPIPETRSCAEAGIPEHYCACYESKEINSSTQTVRDISNFVVDELNELLKNYQDSCAKISLNRIQEAHVISAGLKPAGGEEVYRFTILKFFTEPEAEKHRRYLVVFETLPGNALFEATVGLSSDSGMSLLGDVSRVNKYGNQSSCIFEKRLRPYCYCK